MNPVLEDQLQVRAAEPSDLAFIFKTWLKSYYYSSPAVLHIPPEVYFHEHHKVAERLLRKSVVPVVCQRSAPGVLLGFAVLEMSTPLCLHWLYVKNAWRKMGVAAKLLGSIDLNTCVYSHWTHAIKGWTAARWPRLRYDPYLQFTP